MEKNTFKKVGKGIASTIFASFLILSTTTVSDAAIVSKKVETDSKIKILNNNVLVPGNIGPIVIDGTTYLPVRSLAGALNKRVSWDGSTKSIYITDTVDPDELKNEIFNLEKFIKAKDASISELEKSVKEKNTKITELESTIRTKDAKIAELEAALTAKSKSSVSLKDLQKQLNKDYGDWSDLELDITLKGDEDEIDVEIDMDLKKNGDNYDIWNKLSDSKIEKFINNIVDDIWDEYEDADIDGEIYDSYNDKELVTFTGKGGKLKAPKWH